MKSNVLD